jgi:hypothetical protein
MEPQETTHETGHLGRELLGSTCGGGTTGRAGG